MMENQKHIEEGANENVKKNGNSFLQRLLFDPAQDADSIPIKKSEIDEKLRRDSTISQNFIVWTTLFVYPLFSALDFLFVNHLWIEFLLLRVILLGVLFLTYELNNRYRKFPELPAHVMLGGVAIQMIFFSIYVPLFAHYYYLILLSVATVFVMSVMVWRPQHAIGQVIGGSVAYLVLISLMGESGIPEYFEGGGFFYLGVLVLSAFVSALRHEFQGKNARIEIYQEKYREILQSEIRNIMVQRDELNRSLSSLEDLNIDKNRFLNVASHGIKNPLSRIFGFLQLIEIEFDGLPEPLTEYLKYIEDSTHEINEVLDRYVNLKAFSKELVMKLEPMDIIPIIKSAYIKNAKEAEGRNIRMSFEAPEVPVEVLSDQLSLKQIMESLLKYSLRLASNNSIMKVIAEKKTSVVQLHITQTKSRVDIDRLNELFNSLETTTRDRQNAMGGQGLGLSLARILTHRLNGNLYYSANPHSGIYFMVEFPLKEYTETEETENR